MIEKTKPKNHREKDENRKRKWRGHRESKKTAALNGELN